MADLTELKNRRIFGSVFEVHVNQSLRSQINFEENGAKTFFNLYSAIFYGAAKLGTSLVQTIPSIKEAWGEPDLEKANIIFKACCLPMISISSSLISEGKGWTTDQKKEVTQSRFEDIACIIRTGIDINHCMNLDMQYNFDVDNNEKGSAVSISYAYLFNAKVSEVIGLPVITNWESIIFPLKNLDGFHVKPEEHADLITVAALIGDSGDIMFRAFEKYSAE